MAFLFRNKRISAKFGLDFSSLFQHSCRRLQTSFSHTSGRFRSVCRERKKKINGDGFSFNLTVVLVCITVSGPEYGKREGIRVKLCIIVTEPYSV